MGKAYTGFDIGTDTLKVVVCDGALIQDMVLAQMPDGMVVDGHVVSLEAMADFIKQSTKGMQGLSKQAAFIIPQVDSLTRRLQIPAMTISELEINLPYEFRDYISQGKDKYLYDYAVLRTEKAENGEISGFDLLAVAATKKVMTDYVDMFKRAGFKLTTAMPVAAALQNLLQGSQSAQGNCCIIDFSYSSTLLHFFQGASYDVSRTIEVGLLDIDREIANEKSVDLHVAANYRSNDFQGILDSDRVKNVYESIAVEVGRALSFYSFSNPDSSIDIAYLSGEGMAVDPLVRTVIDSIELLSEDIARIMPPAQQEEHLRTQCAEAVGVTMN